MMHLLAGRYRINHMVGQGATAVVYSAQDSWLDDQPVALKVCHNIGAADLLSRELALLFPLRHPHLPRAHALHRLSDHHGIEGIPKRAPFLVEELCMGQPADLWAQDRGPAQVAMVGAQIAAALAALHCRGIVHGDVKPGNILVAGETDAFAKLIDFNLATRGESASVCGTLRYMAPEALCGQRCAASDIYSLGATLTHLITGAPPTGHHGAQLQAPALTDAIAAMSHAQPEQRADAATAFELLLQHVQDDALPALVTLRDAPHVSSGFAGRDDFTRALTDTLDRSRLGTHVLHICGPNGIGKSAALEHGLMHAALRGYRVLGGRNAAPHGELQCLENLMVDADDTGSGAKVTSTVDHPPADLEAAQWRHFSLLAERLTTIATEEPLALVFDDVPAHSPLDRFAAFLERLGEKGPRMVWLQATGTPTGSPPATSSRSIELRSLDVAAIGEALKIARPLRPRDEQAAAAVHTACGGNPRGLNALLTAFVGDRLLRAANDAALTQTDSMRQTVRLELEKLNEPLRRLVTAVSLFEGPVPAELLHQVPAIGDTVPWEDIAAACQIGLLQQQASVNGLTLGVPGNVIAAELRRVAQASVVRSVVETLEAGFRRRYPAEIGRLWQMLSEPTLAWQPLLEGARLATAELRWGDAVELYHVLLANDAITESTRDVARVESARVLLGMGKTLEALERFSEATSHPEARLGLAETQMGLGRYKDAASTLRQAAAHASEDSAKRQAMLARAQLFAGSHQSCRELAQEALQTNPDHPYSAELHMLVGLVAFYAGDLAQALSRLERAHALASRAEDNRLLDKTRANWAMVLQKSGDLAGAERAYAESLAAARAGRDLPLQLQRLTNLAALRQDQGQLEAALDGFQEAFELAHLVDGQREKVRVGLNWANLLCFVGDKEAAHSKVEPAMTAAQALGMRTEGAYLNLVAGEVALALGDNRGATDHADRAAASFADGGDQAALAEANALHAMIALHQRDAKTARSLAHKALKQAQNTGRERIIAQAQLWQALAELEEPGAPDAAIAAATSAAESAARRGDVDVGWIANAAASRLHARTGRAQDARFHLEKARRLATAAAARLSARYQRTYCELWYRRELWAVVHQSGDQTNVDPNRDLDRLLAINRELAQDHDPDRLLERVIDAAIALSGAERGFIILRGDADDDLTVRAARNIDHETLDQEALNISRSIALEAMQAGLPVTSVNALDDDRFREFLSVHQMKLRSVLCLPLRAPQRMLGALYLDNRYRVNAFSEADVALLAAFGDQAAIALANARHVTELAGRSRALELSRAQIEELNQRLERELAAQSQELALARRAQDDAPEETGRHGMVGKCQKMLDVYRVIDRIADKDIPVTILGESGTGKELVARAIHAPAAQNTGPFVSVNCGAIPGELLESELFGHERGAFTGAVRSKPGLFEVAQNGTIFLDEIGDMPLSMQVKLLRVLQQREFRRVGGTENLQTNARVLSASNRDLGSMVRSGEFREDLWYRLNVVEIHLPPLRERREDLPALIHHLIARHGGSSPPQLSRPALAALLDHDWPGNIRELENECQRAIALADDVITPDLLSDKVKKRARTLGGTIPLKQSVEDFEKEALRIALVQHQDKVAAAAKALGLTRAGLYKKLHKYGLVSSK